MEESHILAILVRPTSIQATRDHKDGRAVGDGLESIVRKRTAAIGILAVSDLLGTAAQLMPCENETIWLVLVVVVGDVEEPVTFFPLTCMEYCLLVRVLALPQPAELAAEMDGTEARRQAEVKRRRILEQRL